MRYSIPSFYYIFYGNEFSRNFLRVPQHQKNIRIKSIVKNPKNLYIHVSRNSGTYPCYASVYDYGNDDALKQKITNHIIYDRLFFDFDASNSEANKLKKDLVDLQTQGPLYNKNLQNVFQEKLQKMVIENRIAEKAIEQARDFAYKIENSFGKPPLLFFSGFKGAHAYLFFDPVKLEYPKESIAHFARTIKEKLEYTTLDTAVTENAPRSNARVPYSVHPSTRLTVIPFGLEDTYEEIMYKSLNPVSTLHLPLVIDNHKTGLGEHLKNNIDSRLVKTLSKNKNETNRVYKHNAYFAENIDLRDFLKKILGEPQKEFKDYIQYNCPFGDHNDSKPSFTVYKTNYICFGCNRKGNYWQFLKDFYGMSDYQIKKSLNNISK